MRLVLTISSEVPKLWSFPKPKSEILQKLGFYAMEAGFKTNHQLERNWRRASDFCHPYYRASFM